MILHPIIAADIDEVIRNSHIELHKLEGKNILITGASGMLARYIVYTIAFANEHLFKKKAHLYLLTRSGITFMKPSAHIHNIKCDVSQKIPKLPPLHFIIHAASKAAPKIYTQHMRDTFETNILGMRNIMKLSSSTTESILFLSSAEIYGQTDSSERIKESYIGKTDHLNDRACYVEGKKAAETLCKIYFTEKKVPVKIARILHTFGPGLNLDDGRVFSDFIRDGLKSQKIDIRGNKKLMRPYLYISDATILFLKILLVGESGEVYNVSTDKNYITVWQLAKIVKQALQRNGMKKISINNVLDKTNVYKHAPSAMRLNISKVKNQLHFVPLVTVEDGIERTVRYFLSQQHET
jgi:nucleoside-diphosphate-sugar epimerase